MVVYYWLYFNLLNRTAKNSFENKIRIWNLCSVFLVHFPTPKPATSTIAAPPFVFNILKLALAKKLLAEVWELMRNCEALWGALQDSGFGITTREKKRRFLPAWMEEFTWLKEENGKIYCDIFTMTGKKTLWQQLAVTIIRSRPWKGTKIRKIPLQVSVTSSPEKAFKWQLQMQRRILRMKHKKLRGHIVQLRTVYVMMKNNSAADNFKPIMELQAANGCSDTSVFTRNPKLFQRWNQF